jgi:adenosylhomocysteine nucleosidase
MRPRFFRAGLLSLVVVMLAGCVSMPRRPFVDDVPRVAIMSAFDAEWLKLRESMQITGTRVVNGRTQYLGRLAGHDVVLLLSGYSMVNAAMTTQALVDHYRLTSIVFSGVAGGVNPGLHVGDVTVPAQWGQYQEHVFARETATGFAPARGAGEFGHFGMLYPRAIPVIAPGQTPDSVEQRFWFDVDSASLSVARRVAGSVMLARCSAKGDCLTHTPQVLVGGRGVSGSTFVDNAAYREWVWTAFKADALDMETAAVALVARQHGVPFIAFRSLSDLAGGGPGENESATFARLASDNSAAVVIAYLQALPH